MGLSVIHKLVYCPFDITRNDSFLLGALFLKKIHFVRLDQKQFVYSFPVVSSQKYTLKNKFTPKNGHFPCVEMPEKS